MTSFIQFLIGWHHRTQIEEEIRFDQQFVVFYIVAKFADSHVFQLLWVVTVMIEQARSTSKRSKSLAYFITKIAPELIVCPLAVVSIPAQEIHIYQDRIVFNDSHCYFHAIFYIFSKTQVFYRSVKNQLKNSSSILETLSNLLGRITDQFFLSCYQSRKLHKMLRI